MGVLAQRRSTSLSVMCCGVGWSGLPMLMSMMSSPPAAGGHLQLARDVERVGGGMVRESPSWIGRLEMAPTGAKEHRRRKGIILLYRIVHRNLP